MRHHPAILVFNSFTALTQHCTRCQTKLQAAVPDRLNAGAALSPPIWPRSTGMLFRLQVGESPRLTAIAELLEEAVQREDGRGTVLEARRIIHLVDSKASYDASYSVLVGLACLPGPRQSSEAPGCQLKHIQGRLLQD